MFKLAYVHQVNLHSSQLLIQGPKVNGHKPSVQVGLAKFDTIQTQHGFYGFGFNIIVFGLYFRVGRL